MGELSNGAGVIEAIPSCGFWILRKGGYHTTQIASFEPTGNDKVSVDSDLQMHWNENIPNTIYTLQDSATKRMNYGFL